MEKIRRPKKPDMLTRFTCKVCDIINEAGCGCKCPALDGMITTYEECPYIPKIRPRLLRLIRKREKAAYERGWARGREKGQTDDVCTERGKP